MFGVRRAAQEFSDALGEILAENKRLKADNDKLRDLCADLAAHLLEAERVHSDHLMPDGYEERMRELGIKEER